MMAPLEDGQEQLDDSDLTNSDELPESQDGGQGEPIASPPMCLPVTKS